MKFLFFFVHPSKFHAFKHTINYLIANGHLVDVLITKKDVLEDLVKQEGWAYTNIFPEGRKIIGIPTYLSAGINLLRTIHRLYKFTKGKKYDLFISDDLLTILSKIRKTPSILFQDSDLAVVPESALLMKFTQHILTPFPSDMGRYNHKRIPYHGYKELSYLHPNHFQPDKKIVESKYPDLKKFFIIRLVFLGATHDVGKKGIDNEKLRKLIDLLEKYGTVFISSERKLPGHLSKYLLRLEKTSDLLHFLAFADIFIGDSQTTTSEAAILGTPAFRFNDFVGKLSVMEEKQEKYELSYGFKTDQFDQMYDKIKVVLEQTDSKLFYQKERERMLKDKIDPTNFMKWLFENYPKSAKIMKENPDYQFNFR